MISLQPPTSSLLLKHLESWNDEPLSYEHTTGIEHPPADGFILDIHRVRLGAGLKAYQEACAALDAWVMFPTWAVVHPIGSPQLPGKLVAMVTCICWLWWINPCRILRRSDDETHHGFVYGTLPEHTECGEERFMVEMLADGSVWYEIRAFSRPRHWLAWIGFPLARWWQLKFVRDSQAAMRRIIL